MDFTTSYRQQFQYKSFLPPKINREIEWQFDGVVRLLEKATRGIGELNAYSKLIPDVDFFIKMHVTKEATDSSQIEEIRTRIGDAVLEREQVDPEDRDDWKEVQNYIEALQYSRYLLQRLPLSMRVLRQAHERLMQGVRGERKQPGEVRRSQNWIGGSNLSTAQFIPPHPDHIPELLSDLEHFLHNDELEMPLLVRCAIAHYQFETIHPFLDGNGRMGRLLIVLQLLEAEYLKHPVLYLSDYLRRHRIAYFDSLARVRYSGSIEQWLRFFLQGVVETTERGIATFERIIELRESYEERIRNLGRRADDAAQLIQAMYAQPKLDVTAVAEIIDKTHQTASSLVAELEKQGILRETTRQSRNRIYSLHAYLDLFR